MSREGTGAEKEWRRHLEGKAEIIEAALPAYQRLLTLLLTGNSTESQHVTALCQRLVGEDVAVVEALRSAMEAERRGRVPRDATIVADRLSLEKTRGELAGTLQRIKAPSTSLQAALVALSTRPETARVFWDTNAAATFWRRRFWARLSTVLLPVGLYLVWPSGDAPSAVILVGCALILNWTVSVYRLSYCPRCWENLSHSYAPVQSIAWIFYVASSHARCPRCGTRLA